MSITRNEFKQLLEAGDIQKLFVKLGWNRSHGKRPLKVGEGDIVQAELLAEKKDFFVAVVRSKEPTVKDRRQKIEKQFTKFHAEHLLVYLDEQGGQVWQLAVRRPQQPIAYHEVPWHNGQKPELLYQKLTGLFVSLDEEDSITVIDVTDRARRQFETNTKKVVKKFYTQFGVQHKAFVKFIKGIAGTVDQQWYASLMLNRLMFIYFIQRKGFLSSDGKGPDPDYLRTKLNESKTRRGEDKFYQGFYREFLLELFHKGLGEADHKKLKKEIGRVPYLNGGLFDEHHLEQSNEIQIEDKAFEKLFDFFGEWQWTLDIRPDANADEINPDVIGYIFEQYINERAEMGAYYTQEDITNYIAKNTIIPWLFEKAKEKDAQAFKPEGGVWGLLRDDPDKYIYKSVQQGITAEMRDALDKEDANLPWWKSRLFNDLPADVRKGLPPEQKDLWKIRDPWNAYVPSIDDDDEQPNKGLPKEIWRELIERRRRYLELRRKLKAGEVTAVNDLITYNLDIQDFVQDVLREHESSDLIWAFYEAMEGERPETHNKPAEKLLPPMSVLDPTCGSGAFLFAALNILKPLYAQCLQRMEAFREQAKTEGKSRRYGQFQPILDDIAAHPNSDYFILKSIILRNLYGVDIMPEAVEIAKLRLFLKLVSTVEPNYADPKGNMGIEPLPDIDFNIRAGNTLVGFATKAEVKGISAWSLDYDAEEHKRIDEASEKVAMAFERFKEIQLRRGENYKAFRAAKDDLEKQLGKLRYELDVYLAKSYTITDLPKQQQQLEKWKASHKPFHWFAEYYGIVHKHGGFDVIIGNPPYVEYAKVRGSYEIQEYITQECGNLYAYVIERGERIVHNAGYWGYIVPLSAFSTTRMSPLQKMVAQRSNYFSCFDFRPSKLFDGVNMRLSVCVSAPKGEGQHSTSYLRWYSETRETLFDSRVQYGATSLGKEGVAKISNDLEATLWKKLSGSKQVRHATTNSSKATLFFHDAILYWIRATDFAPSHGAYLSSHVKSVDFQGSTQLEAACCIVNSTLFYWWWTKGSNCRDLNVDEVLSFPVDLGTLGTTKPELLKMHKGLMKDFVKNSEEKVRIQRQTGAVHYREFNPVRSKDLIDEIDALLGAHYGLSEEELDHVISYDIKYRMGDELEGVE